MDSRLRLTEQHWLLPKHVDVADTLEYYGGRSDAQDLIDLYLDSSEIPSDGDDDTTYAFCADYIMGVVKYTHDETGEARERPFVIKMIPAPVDI